MRVKSGISHFRFQMVLLAVALSGCAKHSTPPAPSTPGMKSPDQTPQPLPILYHRTGGIAATDDRVVIWPDGVIDVSGKLMPAGSARLPKDRLDHLTALFADWDQLKNQYLASNVADAYIITISHGDKSIEASDLAPDLPPQFRQVFTEIEALAAGAGQEQPSPQSPVAPPP